MTRVLLCTTSILISLLVSSVNCQQDVNSIWERIKQAWKSFTGEVKSAWNDFKEELRSRTSDFSDWTQEMWENLKQKMKEWMNERNDISESEKEDMNNFIERLKMPPKENER